MFKILHLCKVLIILDFKRQIFLRKGTLYDPEVKICVFILGRFVLEN